MVKFKEYRIEDVLSWQPQKEIDPLKISELTVKKDKTYPFYGQATLNNGIISYLSLAEHVLNNPEGKPTILIHSNNQNIVYLETPFYLKDGHGATSVLQSEFLNEKIALYLMTSIKKVITKKFSYNEKATKIALKNTYIQLPVNDKEEIDYEYMERYISELEEERIGEFDSYLKVSNLENYEITEDEARTLAIYSRGDLVTKDFFLHELFVASNGDVDIQQKHINGKGNIVISSGVDNVGIIGRSDISSRIFERNTITIDMFGNVNFRDFQYKMVTHARVFSLKYRYDNFSENVGLYFVSQLFYLKRIFSYSNMASWDKIKTLKIKLPINEYGEIHYDYMESFIQFQKKLVIKDVVNWKDLVISKEKQII